MSAKQKEASDVADFEIVETRADLDLLVQDLLAEKIVAIDTEADSFYHYFDKTCLVQVATRKQIHLIDPLALGGPAELAPLLDPPRRRTLPRPIPAISGGFNTPPHG